MITCSWGRWLPVPEDDDYLFLTKKIRYLFLRTMITCSWHKYSALKSGLSLWGQGREADWPATVTPHVNTPCSHTNSKENHIYLLSSILAKITPTPQPLPYAKRAILTTSHPPLLVFLFSERLYLYYWNVKKIFGQIRSGSGIIELDPDPDLAFLRRKSG
jgi:hypothetical protein